MALLYVRTGNGGSDPDFLVVDLGKRIPTGASWTLLNAGGVAQAEDATGDFSSRALRDSQDLYDAINAGNLEWSKDGSIQQAALNYVADYALLKDFQDDELDLEDGAFLVPRGPGLDTSEEGKVRFDTDEQQLYIGTTSGWEGVDMAASRVVLIDEVPASKFTYVGEAPPGTATTVSGWRIYRLDESSGGDEELIKLYANDSTSFDQVWDDRTTLSYVLP